METTIGAIFIISMLILAAGFIYFLIRGPAKAAETIEEEIEEERAEEHLPEPGVDPTPPATGLLMEEIPKGERIPEKERPERAGRE